MPLSSADAFTALARSSPWRWSTLRFTVRWTLPYPTWPEPVRGWIRRPDGLRVETLSGQPLSVLREDARPGNGPAPEFRGDGLVALRPSPEVGAYDVPMFQDYRWVAMLDPVELADGRDHETGEPSRPALAVDTVRDVEHAGRPAWEAEVRPTSLYEPRCACCPLLRAREIDLLEYANRPECLLTAYPDAHRVRLDAGTGVCVSTTEIGGLTPGAGHDLRIEAVDEPMPDSLFVPPRRGRVRLGWSPLPGTAPQ